MKQGQIQNHRQHIRHEIKSLTRLLNKLQRDGLLWASYQVMNALETLQEIQIVEEPTDQDINWFNTGLGEGMNDPAF